MKITWCHSRLAIGSVSNGEVHPEVGLAVIDALQEAGITHLINCRRDPEYARGLHVLRGVNVLWNSVEDDGEPKAAEWFGRSIDFALGALASPHHRVCVCCYNGNNRAPSTALAILMAQGVPAGVAMDLVRGARPEAEVGYWKDAEDAITSLGYR